MLTLERGLPSGLHSFLNELKQVFTMEITATRCRPSFQHQYLLSKLQSHGYRIAVCSNSVRASVELMMQKASLMGYLDFFLSNQDVSIGKPNPEIYLKAIERLNLSPDECLVVEDNHNGILAARASGAHVLEVAGVEEVNWPNVKAALNMFGEGAHA
jgi:HAD superfamily hydrolase (TIGR01509 family)